MNKESIQYKVKEAAQTDVRNHLLKCSDSFVPPLATRINIEDYSSKIFDKAITFEAWDHKDLIGVIAAYFNSETLMAFITNVSVVKEYMGLGIAAKLLKMCIDHAEFNGYHEIKLEVNKDNFPAVNFYKKHKFTQVETKADSMYMSYQISKQ